MKKTKKVEERQNALVMFSDWASRRGLFGGCGYYRIIQPFRYVNNIETWVYGIVEEANDPIEYHKSFCETVDLMFAKHFDNPKAIEMIFEVRDKTKNKLIVDFDDDVFSIDKKSMYYDDWKEGTERRKAIEFEIRNADALVVSTEYLKGVYSKYNKNIFVCPNSIDFDDWQDVTPKSRDDGKIYIGWSGSPTHESDLELIAGALNAIMKKNALVNIICNGYVPECFKILPQDRIEYFKGTMSYIEYPQYLAGLGMDIGIAPLAENEFNKSKSNIKWMEYAMCGVPTIASTFTDSPYNCITDNYDGLLATNEKDWIEKLEMLIEDKVKRVRIADNAKATIKEKHNIKKNYVAWEKAIDTIIS